MKAKCCLLGSLGMAVTLGVALVMGGSMYAPPALAATLPPGAACSVTFYLWSDGKVTTSNNAPTDCTDGSGYGACDLVSQWTERVPPGTPGCSANG